jgi:DNA-binding response OmpR family regulator
LGLASGSVLIIAVGWQGQRAGHLSEVLRNAGYKVEIVSGPVHQTTAQLVVLSGFKSFLSIRETCRICSTIRSNAPHLPIFVVGPDDLDTKVSLFEAGADDYLPLSFDHQEFLARGATSSSSGSTCTRTSDTCGKALSISASTVCAIRWP